MISQHYFTAAFYVPRMIRLFRNWPTYLSNYLLRQRKPAQYQFRNGFRLNDGTGTLAGTIAVVFVRREYGLLKTARTVVDIGGNMGSFTVFAAMNYPDAQIYTFEPEARNFGLLNQNISLNSLEKRVHTYQCAVASSSGPRALAIDHSPLNTLISANREAPTATVDCVSLQSIFEDHKLDTVDLLKMNCEGAEYEIFENCPNELFSRMLNIRLEYHNLDSNRRNGDALEKLLASKGFRIERKTRYRDVSGFIWATRTGSNHL